MKNTKTLLKIVGWACVAIMLILLVMQFLPYWTGNDQTASISEYVWNPAKYKRGLTVYFQSLYGSKWAVGDMVNTPLIVLVSSVVTILFTGFLSTNILGYFAPAIGGVLGAIGYLSTPIFHLNGIWVVHLVLCILACALAVFGFVVALKLFIDENKRKGLL